MIATRLCDVPPATVKAAAIFLFLSLHVSHPKKTQLFKLDGEQSDELNPSKLLSFRPGGRCFRGRLPGSHLHL